MALEIIWAKSEKGLNESISNEFRGKKVIKKQKLGALIASRR